MLCVGKIQPSALSGLSQLHLVAGGMITDQTQRFHSDDTAEQKRMAGHPSSEQGREERGRTLMSA